MNRKEILAAANKAVHAEDMEHDYGSPEDNFATIAGLWNAYLEALDCDCLKLEERDIAAMMVLLKVARVANSTKADHWVDIAGYAACGGEIDGTPEEWTATMRADNMEVNTDLLQTLGTFYHSDGHGPFELKFKVKKEDE